VKSTSGSYSYDDFTTSSSSGGHEVIETFDSFLWCEATHSTHPEIQTLDAPVTMQVLTKLSRTIVPYVLPRLVSLTVVQDDSDTLKEALNGTYLSEEP
jgi:hypothetical protein